MGQKWMQQAAQTPRRVLVVDDEPLMGTTLQMALAEEHEVVVVESGEAGVVLLARDPRFDVILCDLMMPGVSGIDLHRELLQTAPHLVDRLVFMSGGAYTTESKEFLERVPNPHLQKPFDMDELLELVRRVGPARPVTGPQRRVGDLSSHKPDK